MLLSVLYSLIFILFPDPQTPNFYSGLTSAREASQKSQKEMVIFFTDKACTNCEAAWEAFTKDKESTSQYISTRMDRGDFDGGIFFDLLGLEQTPSWVILYPDGTEKERWKGGWKDASGNPTLFDMHTQISNITPQQKTITQETKSPPKTNPVTALNTETASSSQIATPAITSSSTQKTFFVQTGYFGSEANAKKMIDDLKSKGINSFEIKPEQKDGKTCYRVISKMYENESVAKVEQQKLSAMGISASIKS